MMMASAEWNMDEELAMVVWIQVDTGDVVDKVRQEAQNEIGDKSQIYMT